MANSVPLHILLGFICLWESYNKMFYHKNVSKSIFKSSIGKSTIIEPLQGPHSCKYLCTVSVMQFRSCDIEITIMSLQVKAHTLLEVQTRQKYDANSEKTCHNLWTSSSLPNHFLFIARDHILYTLSI